VPAGNPEVVSTLGWPESPPFDPRMEFRSAPETGWVQACEEAIANGSCLQPLYRK